MAKYELNVYDTKTGEVAKTLQKNFMPSALFIRYQQVLEKINEDTDDTALFDNLKPLFLETFPDLTEKEYTDNTDVAEVLALFRKVLNKATTMESGKNA
ncbi:MAG: hypothetical protein IKG80_04865 [Clostridia bacterium]|nr:hypothetical protein [Clostridia bacterium]